MLKTKLEFWRGYNAIQVDLLASGASLYWPRSGRPAPYAYEIRRRTFLKVYQGGMSTKMQLQADDFYTHDLLIIYSDVFRVNVVSFVRTILLQISLLPLPPVLQVPNLCLDLLKVRLNLTHARFSISLSQYILPLPQTNIWFQIVSPLSTLNQQQQAAVI